MAEASKPSEGSSTTKAVKDRACEYCGQKFTSSSLGRHLDQFIKARNPKAPDGVHDVERIRKTRGAVTRRQQRASMASLGGQPASVSGATAIERSKKSSSYEEPESPAIFKSPESVREPGPGSGSGRRGPFSQPWQTTNARNNLQRGPTSRSTEDFVGSRDLENNARATELALRDLINSLRAAKQQIHVNLMPFDIDPLTLDFPALVLRFLPAPGTLFASIPMSTSSSWSIEPPGQNQRDALKNYFIEAIKKWKTRRAVAATTSTDQVIIRPSSTPLKPGAKEELNKADERVQELEGKIFDHLYSTFRSWSELQEAEREWYWKLELARGVSRNQKQVDELKASEHDLQRKNSGLKSQLLRLQQASEPGIVQPSTILFEQMFVDFLTEDSATDKRQGVGLVLGDHDSDLDIIVSKLIDRWKSRTASSRSPTARVGNSRLPRGIETGAPVMGGSVGVTAHATRPPSRGQAHSAPVQGLNREPQASLHHQPQVNVPRGNKIGDTAQRSSESLENANDDQNGDEDNTDGEKEDESEADEDADGDEDGDADSDVDADGDADGDAEMEEVSPYQTITSPEGVSHQQQHAISSQQQHAISSQQQHVLSPQEQQNAQQQHVVPQTHQHALSSQQNHQHSNPPGPIRTRPSGSQGRFNPFQNNSPSARSVTQGGGITGNNASRAGVVPATGGNNPAQMLNQPVGSSNMAALHILSGEVGGGGASCLHPQYLNTLGNNHSHLTSGGVGQGLAQGVALGQAIGQADIDTKKWPGFPAEHR